MTGEGTSGDERLISVLGDLAIHLEDADQGPATLEAVVESAIAIVPGARWAGISLIRGREVISAAPSAEVVVALDRVQSETNEGPCLTALREHHSVHIPDMSNEDRWPAFVAAARERHVGSLLSFQLYSTSENLGALNLYAGEPNVFDHESVAVGDVVAQLASVALAGSAAEAQFISALSTRDEIGQAKGILMHRAGVDADMAFHMMVKVSQDTNTKIAEVARRIVADHLTTLSSRER